MLIIKLNEGDYVMIGGSIKVHFDHKVSRDTLDLGVEAPSDVTVLRGKLYEEGVAELAKAGDKEALLLYEKLKKAHKERRHKSNIRRRRRQKQEDRISVGEIKPYNSSVTAQ